jgi:hypothetical protein
MSGYSSWRAEEDNLAVLGYHIARVAKNLVKPGPAAHEVPFVRFIRRTQGPDQIVAIAAIEPIDACMAPQAVCSSAANDSVIRNPPNHNIVALVTACPVAVFFCAAN